MFVFCPKRKGGYKVHIEVCIACKKTCKERREMVKDGTIVETQLTDRRKDGLKRVQKSSENHKP